MWNTWQSNVLRMRLGLVGFIFMVLWVQLASLAFRAKFLERSLVFFRNKEEAAKPDFLFRSLCRRTGRNSSFLDPTVAEIAEQRNK